MELTEHGRWGGAGRGREEGRVAKTLAFAVGFICFPLTFFVELRDN